MSQSEPMYQWVIYDHPKDFPDVYVARKWEIKDGKFEPTQEIKKSKNIDELRKYFFQQQLFRIVRMPGDDPCIVEVWI